MNYTSIKLKNFKNQVEKIIPFFSSLVSTLCFFSGRSSFTGFLLFLALEALKIVLYIPGKLLLKFSFGALFHLLSWTTIICEASLDKFME